MCFFLSSIFGVCPSFFVFVLSFLLPTESSMLHSVEETFSTLAASIFRIRLQSPSFSFLSHLVHLGHHVHFVHFVHLVFFPFSLVIVHLSSIFIFCIRFYPSFFVYPFLFFLLYLSSLPPSFVSISTHLPFFVSVSTHPFFLSVSTFPLSLLSFVSAFILPFFHICLYPFFLRVCLYLPSFSVFFLFSVLSFVFILSIFVSGAYNRARIPKIDTKEKMEIGNRKDEREKNERRTRWRRSQTRKMEERNMKDGAKNGKRRGQIRNPKEKIYYVSIK